MVRHFFVFSHHHTTFRRECLAGLSTFATMAYILVVIASILNDGGMDFGAVLVASIIVTVFASVLMGMMTNFPIVIAPGMGVSSYIVYTVILIQGRTWQEALGAVLIVGVILLILTLLRVRGKIINEIPASLRLGVTGGVGLFLMCVGLKHAGIITHGGDGLVSMGNFWTLEALLVVIGVVVIVALEFLHIKSAYMIAILLAWGFAFVFGLTDFKGVVALPPSLLPTFLQLDLSGFFCWTFLKVLFSIFLVTLLDSSAALVTLAKQADLLDEKGKVIKVQRALIPDALGSILGSLIGSGSLAIHLESAVGIKAEGKTGWVAICVAFCFLGSLFFYPVVETIPHFAAASVLIVLGFFMFRELLHIPWKQTTEVIPALITALVMPLTMSIFNGFAFGFIAYSFLKLLIGRIQKVHPFVWVLSILFLVYQIFLEV